MSDLLNKIILAVFEGVTFVGFLNVFNLISDGDDFKFEFVPDVLVPFVLWVIVSFVFYIIGNVFEKRKEKNKNKPQ